MKIRSGVGLTSPNILDWTTIKHRAEHIIIRVYSKPVEAPNSKYSSQKRLKAKVLFLFKFCESSAEIVFPPYNLLKNRFLINMIIFREIKKSLVFCGVESPQSEKNNRFNLRNLMILVFFSASTTIMSLFMICEDGTMAEYSSAIYGCLSSTMTTIILLIFVWKTKELYKLINNFETTIEEREFLD